MPDKRKAPAKKKAAPKKKQTTKRRRGAPSKWKDEYLERAFRLALLGLTNEEIAKRLGVTKPTLYSWLKQHGDLFNALKEARDEADANVVESLYRRATGFSKRQVKIFVHYGKPIIVPYDEYYPPDTGAAFGWLKNRRPTEWRDKKLIETKAADPDNNSIPGHLQSEERKVLGEFVATIRSKLDDRKKEIAELTAEEEADGETDGSPGS